MAVRMPHIHLERTARPAQILEVQRFLRSLDGALSAAEVMARLREWLCEVLALRDLVTERLLQ